MRNTTSKQSRSGFAAIASSFALALGISSTTALGALVDKDHSAESAKYSETGSSGSHNRMPKSGIFVDHDHSAESVDRNAPRSSYRGPSGNKSAFVDWDHSAGSIGS